MSRSSGYTVCTHRSFVGTDLPEPLLPSGLTTVSAASVVLNFKIVPCVGVKRNLSGLRTQNCTPGLKSPASILVTVL